MTLIVGRTYRHLNGGGLFKLIEFTPAENFLTVRVWAGGRLGEEVLFRNYEEQYLQLIPEKKIEIRKLWWFIRKETTAEPIIRLSSESFTEEEVRSTHGLPKRLYLLLKEETVSLEYEVN